MPPVPAVEVRGITKHFGRVVACDGVDLTVLRGEIHGLLGQNGAGKSTLMRIVTGLVPPDAGRVLIDGRAVVVRDPRAAAALGLAMVHQDFSLVGPLTVWENIALGEHGRVDAQRAIREVEEIGARYGLRVDPTAKIDDLSIAQRQRVEIIKCLRRNPEVLILDEPTSVLTIAESRELFEVLRRVVQQEHRAVVLISHKLGEILHATDRVTVMRDGQVVARLDTAETDAGQLARQMVGREVSLRSEGTAIGLLAAAEISQAQTSVAQTSVTQTSVPAGEVALRITGAKAVGTDGRTLLDGLSLEVRRGEILGVAGVEGNGQAALGDLLSSLLELRAGSVEVLSRPVRPGRAGLMHRAGVSVIPEDRQLSGCVLDMSVAENLVLHDVDQVCTHGFLSARRLRLHASQLMARFSITASSTDAPMRSLSGGNQQRVVLARELSSSPAVLVASQPTRGLDVGAIEYVTSRIREAAASGVAVLLISTELEEILELSHRIAVIHRGRIVGEMARGEVDVERLGLLMGGQAA